MEVAADGRLPVSGGASWANHESQGLVLHRIISIPNEAGWLMVYLRYKIRRPHWAEWGKGVPGSKDTRAELWRQEEQTSVQGRGKGGTGGARPPLGHQGALRPQTELAHQKEQPFPSCKTCKCLNGLPSYPCPHCPVSSTGRSTNKSLHALFHLDACFIRGPELTLKVITNTHLIIMQFSTAISWGWGSGESIKW